MRSFIHARALALSLATLALAACSGPASPDGADGSSDATSDLGGDVARDTGPADAGLMLYGPCTANADCGGTLRCDTTYPGGLCTRRCTRESECGANGHCANSQCVPACTQAGRECSPTTTCDYYDPANPDNRGCFPACSQTAPDGGVACNTGLMCNSYNGAGQCDRTGSPTTGGANGDPCMSDSDCKGRCDTEFDQNGEPTFSVGGECVSYGRSEDYGNYQVGAPYPRGNCPAGSVAVPIPDPFDDGDVAICLRECTTTSDCRLGYDCFHFETSGGQSTTGYCGSINCLYRTYAAMPNNHCPDGYTCEAIVNPDGTRDGRCTANAFVDGGVDGGGDAAADAVGDSPGDAVSTDVASDAGEVDAGAVDTGEVDAGDVDAGEVDAGIDVIDAGEVDAGADDAADDADAGADDAADDADAGADGASKDV